MSKSNSIGRIKYKVGVIGCGNIFDRHVEAILSNKDHFKLVAICDIDPTKVDTRSKEYKVPGYLNYRDMLKDMKGKMNLVVIATPNSYHYEQALDSLNCGYNILIEKPVAFSHEKVEKVMKLAKELKKEAYCVLQVRYNPSVSALRSAMKNKILGDVRSVSLTQRWQRPSSYFDSWRADINIGGRTLYEVGIHYLDIVQCLFGLPVVKSSTSFNNKHKNVGFEDTVFAILQFPSKASGSIEVTIASEPSNLECSISVMGSMGYIKISGKALNEIEVAMFNNPLSDSIWKKITEKHAESISPNSYGTHLGSCPNHPTLYYEIAKGRGLKLSEAVNSIRFIEEIYEKEVK